VKALVWSVLLRKVTDSAQYDAGWQLAIAPITAWLQRRLSQGFVVWCRVRNQIPCSAEHHRCCIYNVIAGPRQARALRCALTGGFQLGFFRPAYLQACIATVNSVLPRAQGRGSRAQMQLWLLHCACCVGAGTADTRHRYPLLQVSSCCLACAVLMFS
jgi:hypothetical protein